MPQLIAYECGLEMPLRTVGEYLNHWGYTPQKSLKRAYEQDLEQVQAWLDIEYPAIKQRAQQENAEIAWGDESKLRSDTQVGRGYAPLSQTPEIQPNTQRVSVNFLASVSNQGKVRFLLYTQTLTAQVFITFLERLIAKRARKLMWIVNRHPVHRSDAIYQWLQTHQDKIEIALSATLLPPVESSRVSQLRCQARSTLEASHPQLGSVKRAVTFTSIQTAKVTHSNRQVFSASIHCLCCLNRCSVNYCRVNMFSTHAVDFETLRVS